MRILSISLLLALLLNGTGWENDFDTARQKAKEQHRLILLEFSGSDWCGPCIRFRKEIVESAEFMTFAEQHLVLLNADFPRLKKNQLSREQQKKNDKLADRYNPEGLFPMTVLLDEEGRKLKTWEGYPDLTVTAFIQQIKTVGDARH